MTGLSRLFFTLSLGGVGGYLFSLAGVPLAWMLGAMLFSAIAAIAQVPVASPGRLRPAMVAVIGVMLGASFTPALLTSVATWWPSMLGLIAAGVIGTAVSYRMLRRLTDFDRATAFFSATPGGLMEMSIMGEERGGDAKSIILVHTFRIFCSVLFLPPILTIVANAGGPAVRAQAAAGGQIIELETLGWLVFSAVAGIFAGRRLRLPAAELMGPMFISAAAHLAGVTTFHLPPELISGAQVVLGVSIGARFVGAPLARLAALLWPSVASMAVHLAIALAMAGAISQFGGIGFMQILLGYAPGGITEMSLVAIAIGADAAFVAAHHLVRVVAALITSPMLFSRTGRSETS